MDQSVVEAVGTIIEKVIGSGIAINGQVGVKGLTITSVDTAKSMGILKESGEEEEKPQGQQSSGQQSSKRQRGQDQSQSSGPVSREEFDSLWEEISYLRKMMETSQQDQPSQRSRGQSR